MGGSPPRVSPLHFPAKILFSLGIGLETAATWRAFFGLKPIESENPSDYLHIGRCGLEVG